MTQTIRRTAKITQTATIKTTIEITNSHQARIRCIARVDMPEYGIKAGQRFHLIRQRGTTYAIKAIKVISREITANGDVISKIVNRDNQMYTTTLRTSGEHGCSCPDTTHRCYHIEILAATEADHATKIHSACMAARPAKTPTSIGERGTLNGGRPSVMDLIKAVRVA